MTVRGKLVGPVEADGRFALDGGGPALRILESGTVLRLGSVTGRVEYQHGREPGYVFYIEPPADDVTRSCDVIPLRELVGGAAEIVP